MILDEALLQAACRTLNRLCALPSFLLAIIAIVLALTPSASLSAGLTQSHDVDMVPPARGHLQYQPSRVVVRRHDLKLQSHRIAVVLPLSLHKLLARARAAITALKTVRSTDYYHESIYDRGKNVGPPGALRMVEDFYTSRPFRERNLARSIGKWPWKLSRARLIGPTVTFGIPTWFVRIVYRSDTFDFGLHPIRANVFISQRNYRVIRLAAHARARNRDGSVYKLTLYERFSRYGVPLRIRLPRKCVTFPRLHIKVTPAA